VSSPGPLSQGALERVTSCLRGQRAWPPGSMLARGALLLAMGGKPLTIGQAHILCCLWTLPDPDLILPYPDRYNRDDLL